MKSITINQLLLIDMKKKIVFICCMVSSLVGFSQNLDSTCQVLFNAIKINDINYVKKMIATNTIDFSCQNKFRDDSFEHAVALHKNELSKLLLDYILENKISYPIDDNRIMHNVIVSGNVEMFKVLLPYQMLDSIRTIKTLFYLAKFIPHFSSSNKDIFNNSEYHLATPKNADQELIFAFLESGKFDFNAVDKQGETILFKITDSSIETIKILLVNTNVDVNAKNTNGETVLDKVISNYKDPNKLNLGGATVSLADPKFILDLTLLLQDHGGETSNGKKPICIIKKHAKKIGDMEMLKQIKARKK